jgi:hypothetical protein
MLRKITVLLAGLLLTMLAASLLFSQGCGKGGGSDSADGPAADSDRVSLTLEVDESAANPRVQISASGSDIYQCSLRLNFDPEVVRPIQVEEGDLFKGDHFFFAPTDKHGFVPVSATLRWRGQTTNKSGLIAAIEFERLAEGDPAFEILDDAAYLIVNDDEETRLPVIISGGAQ